MFIQSLLKLHKGHFDMKYSHFRFKSFNLNISINLFVILRVFFGIGLHHNWAANVFRKNCAIDVYFPAP